MKKQRLDQLVVERGLADSRERAQRLILAGLIRVGGQVATKPGHDYPPDAVVEREAEERFVSRGGHKLEGAFEAFGLDVAGKRCLDVGASTGGFTDCLLQHGAAVVVAVDVGHAQLHPKMLNDPRVVSIEGFNARYMTAADLPWRPEVAVTDVSFISLTLILPPMNEVLLPGGVLVALIKPQFEAGREQVGHGGVVRDPAVHEEVKAKICNFARDVLRLEQVGLATSPLTGPAGNVEFLACWRKPTEGGATA